MNNQQLIPVIHGFINNEATQLVNARTLHVFLESKQRFSDWIKKRIAEYGFVENQDYLQVFDSKPSLKNDAYKTTTSGDKIDYQLSLEMAKELAMVERNDKGREARRYFIECEKKLHEAIKENSFRQLPTLHIPLVPHEVRQIKEQISNVVRYFPFHAHKSKAYSVIYAVICATFKISKIEHLSASDLHTALAILNRMQIQGYAYYSEAYGKEEAALKSLHLCAGLPVPPAHIGQVDLLQEN